MKQVIVMQKLFVNEIFYSLQGEGVRAGEASIFIRLSGCNLTCSYCDTEFESKKEMSVEEILTELNQYSCRWIVWTGGEPASQLTDKVVQYFKENNFKQAIETNGSMKLPKGIDWIAVSPKVAEHIIKKNFTKVHELRYTRNHSQSIPIPSIDAEYYFLSPINDGDIINKQNLQHCIDLCLNNPQWKLNLQMHKIWKVQ